MAYKGTREADHAGSWYSASPGTLSRQLDQWLDEVPDTINESKLPVTSARVIIAPHAGYSYSGPCAAWAYKSLDLSNAKRIFLLGPSHTYYLKGCALTTFEKYATPFGDFVIDQPTTDALRKTDKFKNMPHSNDVSEHSLEMHLPYLWKRVEQTIGKEALAAGKAPLLVPILVGDGLEQEEKSMAETLLPYMRDPENVFVISSDFCHWGRNFRYRVYCDGEDLNELETLRAEVDTSGGKPPIHEAIRVLDEAAFAAIESGVHHDFREYLDLTDNTVCGRHPIGVAMAALEMLAKEAGSEEGKTKGEGKFTFVQYQRSNLVEKLNDTSVSYAAAYAIV